jgi:hypothetical protein
VRLFDSEGKGHELSAKKKIVRDEFSDDILFYDWMWMIYQSNYRATLVTLVSLFFQYPEK